jgi:hypothetical protein
MLTQFIDLTILKEIGRARLAKFLQPFEPDLKQSNLLLSIPDPDSIGYLAALATLFDSWGLLPDKLRQALLTLEAAAAPQNHDRLQAAIQRRIPRVGVSETCALDRALELWFHAPDELAQFAPPVPIQEPVPENSGDGDSRNTEHAIRNTESASSTIQNPESSIENPESSPAPNLRPPVLHSPPSKVLLTKEGTFDEGGSTLNSQLSPSSGPSINHQLPTINQPQPFPARLLNLPAVTPWGDPVDGKLLLDEIVRNLTRFVVLPRFAPETLALWIVHTYAFQLRDVTTYIGLESPAHRCGKSTLVTVLSELANRAVVASNVSSPAFYRVIEQIQPTLLIDEADTFMHGNEELRGILNSGYQKKTAYVLRAVNQVPQNPASAASPTPHSAFPTPHSSSGLANFSCWCPKVIARIGALPATLADRCIVFRMQRKTPNERCERIRNLNAYPLKQQCARFVADHATAIAAAQPQIPTELNDRAADIWEPLLAIADLAGGNWPELARQAAVALAAAAQDTNPIGSLLLDIFLLFASHQADRMFTRQLVQSLNCYADRPWADMRNGKEINDQWLSHQLRPYGIQPRTLRIGELRAKGYFKDDFQDVFRRYISKSDLRLRLSELTPDESPPGPNETNGDPKP